MLSHPFLQQIVSWFTTSSKSRNIIALLSATTILANVAAYYYLRLPRGPDRSSWARCIFGHRGCRNIKNIPENTIEAFQYFIDHAVHPASTAPKSTTVETKYVGIECDVRLCKTGELVVFHDAFCEPLIDNESAIKACNNNNNDNNSNNDSSKFHAIIDCTLDQLRQMTYRDDDFKKVRMPTALETCLFCKNNNLKLLLELKGTPGMARQEAAKVVELYQNPELKEFMKEQCTVISFQPDVLYHMRALCPDIAAIQLMRNDVATLRTAPTAPTKLADGTLVSYPKDPYPNSWNYFPKFWDNLLWLAFQIAPYLSGCSGVSPRFDHFSTADRAKSYAQGFVIYLWGFEKAEQFNSDMQKEDKLLIAMDYDYLDYKFV